MSPSEPIFDEATLTLKVRLEAANPQRALKPGMFVDVEFPVDLPATLVVPADAIVDSGLRKTVFVDRGHGYFEPRLIETGWRGGDDVEVTKGLMPGERIVIWHLLRRFREPHEGARARHRPHRCSIRCAACTWIPGSRQPRPHGGARWARVRLLFGKLQAAIRRGPVSLREAAVAKP